MRRAGELLAKADVLRRLGRYDEALEVLGQAVARAPHDGRIHAVRSMCLRPLGRREEALAAAETAVAAAPDLADGHLARARALLEMAGGAPQAVGAASEALRLAPHAVPVLQVLGTAYLACGDPSSAERVARLILAENADDPEGHFLLGSVALARQDWEAARTHLERTLGLVPASVSTMVNLGLVESHRGDHDAATQWFRRAAQADPGGPAAARRVATAIHERARAHLVADRPKKEALVLLRSVLATADPGRPAFVTAMLTALLGTMLLSWHEGDPAANVVAGIELLESVADVEPEAWCPAPTSQGTALDPAADALVRELHTAAWVGGVDFRQRLRLQWRQDAAECQLVAVPVAGGRQARVSRCLAMLAGCREDVEGIEEPFARARLHMTAGRAELMRQDGVRRENVARAVQHFETALEVYVRLRSISLRSAAETYLGSALLGVDPDPAGNLFARSLTLLENACRSRSRQGARQTLAVTEAGLGEAHYRRLRAFGDPADVAPGLAHLETAAALFAEVGQLVGQAHFLVFQSRTWAIRPDGDPEQNRLTALAVLDRAQPLVSRDGSPIRWAMVQAETALLLTAGPRSAPALEQAVELARAAASVPDPQEDPKEWASNLRAYALALAARAELIGDPEEAAEAVDAVRAAFPVLAGLATLPEVAELHGDVARVLRLAGVCTGRMALLDEAAQQLGQGLEIARTRGYRRPEAVLLAEADRLTGAEERLRRRTTEAREVLHG